MSALQRNYWANANDYYIMNIYASICTLCHATIRDIVG